jgi:hypothetical protein
MTRPRLQDPDSPPRLAARRFAQALTWTALAPLTSRIEAVLPAAGRLEDLFALEDGLTRAWPPGERPAPVCELMWAGGAAGLEPQALALAAFDEAGRMLLRRTYPAGSGPHG